MKLRLADILTFLNLLLGFLAILAIIERYVFLGAVLILMATILDYFDGLVARKTLETKFGKELDSLADLVSFGLAPASLGFIYSFLSSINTAILSFFVLAGAFRLARFNITKDKYYFTGLPITTAGIIIPIWFFLALPFMEIVFLILGALFISRFKFKKI